MNTDRYDAIVVGGGHNGLVNGAYLARTGLKTLILERRHLVGGAAITEELRPGFWFTTFSYALSLLRPQIIQELELTKHGFLPLLMSTRFAPGEDGEYLLFNRDHDETLREISRLSPHDADGYEQYSHDLDRVCQAIKPLFDSVPPDIFSDDPEELVALAAVGSRLRSLDKRTLHNAVRHSQVSQFEVTLRGHGNTLDLSVRDEGIGFDVDAASRGPGLGLTSMKERLKLIGGELIIESQSAGGTTVIARVPVRQA